MSYFVPVLPSPPLGRRPRRLSLVVLVVSAALCAGLVALPRAVAEPRQSLTQVQASIDSLRREAEHAGERYNDAKVRLTEVNRGLKKARKQLARQQSAVADQRDVIGQLAAASYKSGGVDATMALLLSDDASAFLSQAGLLEQLSKRQLADLRAMTRVRQQLAQARAEVAQQKAQAQALLTSLAIEKRTVESKLAAANRLFSQLTAADRARLRSQARLAAARARASRGTYVRASRDARTSEQAAPSAANASDDDAGSGRAAIALRTAYAQLGDPYRWGGTGPNSFDCSGLTRYAWGSAGVSLPHSSAAQYASGRKISRSELRPGDLVFYYRPISHVALYIGGGRVLDAPYPGKSVHITSIDTMPYVGAVRP